MRLAKQNVFKSHKVYLTSLSIITGEMKLKILFSLVLCLLFCGCQIENKLISMAEEKSFCEMDSFVLENVISNPGKRHHNLRHEEGDSVFSVLCIMTGKNRILSLMYRQFDDGSESYEKCTVSKFVNIKKVRKFRHYSELKKAYGSAAWHEKNDLGFDRYVYMQKAIDFTLIPIRFSAAVDSRIVEILVKDDDIVSVEEIYVMNV